MGNIIPSSRAAVRAVTSVSILGLSAFFGPITGHAEAQSASPPAAEEQQGGLEEIIVTAQRREENLQDVPIAVSAVTADSLERAGIQATREISQVVPSVQMTRSGPSGLFFVRGVGTTNAAAGEEGANAVYIDNVYVGDLAQTINNFNNIARVEVLKGPQGTLFGRNATGGLIHIITRSPADEFEMKGQIGLANYETVNTQLYVGGPISESLKADIAWTGLHQNKGWGRNLVLNRKTKTQEFWGLRSKIVFEAADGIKFTLGGDYNKGNDNIGLAWKIDPGTFGLGSDTNGDGIPEPNLGPAGHDSTANHYPLTRLKTWGLSLIGEFDLGFATLTSITATRRTRNHSQFDVDGGPLDSSYQDYVSTAKTIQQELRLASSNTDPLSWQLGVFYLRSEAATDALTTGTITFNPVGRLGNRTTSSLNTDSYAAFGEATYAITPTTRITAGLRYTMDRRDFDGGQAPVAFNGTVGARTATISSLKYSELTYRLALRQEITDDINVYASVNKGFKAGAYSLQAPTSPPVRPQYIMAYEVGLKSQLFDRRLRLNLAAYHYDIDDYQIRSAIGSVLVGSTILLNAATVKVDGFDLDFEAAPVEPLRLFGGLTLLKSRFDQFGGPGAPFQAPIVYPNVFNSNAALRTRCVAPGTRDPGVVGTGPFSGGYTTCYGDVSGNRTPMAPKMTASFGASLTLPTGEDSSLRLSALYSYNSGYVFDPDNKAKQGRFSLVNASMEYRATAQLGIEVWGKNLTDKEYSVQKLTTGAGTTTALGAPRTYGINLKYDF